MQVRELMSTDVVSVEAGATLHEAAGRLLGRGVGSVVVVSADGTPSGFVTDTDMLRAAHDRETALDAIPVAEVAHPVDVTAAPEDAVTLLAARMADQDVKRVPVLDGLTLVGVITLTDIAWHLSDLRKEAIDAGRHPDAWEAN